MKVQVITLLLLFMLVSQPAFGWFHQGEWNIFHDIKKLSQNFVETITINPEQKQKIILSNMAQWQTDKEQLTQQGITVSSKLDDVIEEKKVAIKEIKTDSTPAISRLIDTIILGQELGKIRQSISEFQEIRISKIMTEEQKFQSAKQLEEKVNNLVTVKNHCSSISVITLLAVENPYKELKTTYCKVLDTVPFETVRSTLYGD